MESEFYGKLVELLKTDSRFVEKETGELLKSEVINTGLKLDKKLIADLLSVAEFKEKFFMKIGEALVFDTNLFQKFLQDKKFLSNSYTDFKNKIGLNIDGKYLKERGEVALVFPFKDCVLAGGMTKEEQKRDEVFFNEILAQDEIDRLLAPKVFSNFKKFTASGESKIKDFQRDEAGTIKDNLIIKGNNLLALHSLKQEFQGKVKLIYIDPPYNTAGDANTFTYNNNFNHSAWLTFMKNRLEVAKNLLNENGVIIVTIDDYEYSHLKVLCDEVFERDNYIGTVIVQSNPRGRTTNTHFATCHEYNLLYAKNIENVFINFIKLTPQQKLDFNEKDAKGEYRLLPFRRSGGTSTPEERPNSFYPIYYNEIEYTFSLENKDKFIEILPIDKLGKKRVWRQTKPSFLEAVKKGDIVCKKSNGKFVIYMKDRIKEGRKPKTIWIDSKYDASANGTMLLKNIFKGEKVFGYPKSLYAVKDIIDIITQKRGNEIILDFFAGSGTTAHATLALNKEDGGNRKFILVEQMNYIHTVTCPRVQKVMDQENIKDNFVYFELKKYNQEAVEKLDKAKSTEELLRIWQEMCERYFLNYDVDIKKFNENQEDFKKLPMIRQKQHFLEMLNKNQLYVNLSEMEDSQFEISEEDKSLTKKFYRK